MSEARAITNLIGNGVATMVVARWEGALDLPRALRILDRPDAIRKKPSPPRRRPSCQFPKRDCRPTSLRSTDLQQQLSRRLAALEIAVRLRGVRERVGRRDLDLQVGRTSTSAQDVADPPQQLLARRQDGGRGSAASGTASRAG